MQACFLGLPKLKMYLDYPNPNLNNNNLNLKIINQHNKVVINSFNKEELEYLAQDNNQLLEGDYLVTITIHKIKIMLQLYLQDFKQGVHNLEDYLAQTHLSQTNRINLI